MPVRGSRKIRKPIILIGAPRSGTTFLGLILEKIPDVAYWVEPRPIWMAGNAYQPSDELGADDLTSRIARRIDGRFHSFMVEKGGSRFAEKTPSNCLRIEFVHALYPDCRIVNLIRDGRQSVRSMLDMQQEPPIEGLLKQRFKETPLTDWPAYVPMYFRTAWRTKVLKKPSTYWGPRPAAWREWIGQPWHVLAARQWKALVSTSTRHGRALPSENYLELRFEELMGDPGRSLQNVFGFLELEDGHEAIEYATNEIDPNRLKQRQQGLGAAIEREVLAELEPTLSEMGYGQAKCESRG